MIKLNKVITNTKLFWNIFAIFALSSYFEKPQSCPIRSLVELFNVKRVSERSTSNCAASVVMGTKNQNTETREKIPTIFFQPEPNPTLKNCTTQIPTRRNIWLLKPENIQKPVLGLLF